MVSGGIVNSWKYKFNLWKFYFEKGYSLMSFPKWAAAIFGIGEIVNKNYMVVIGGTFAFFIICLIIGWIWIKYEFFVAEIEVTNQYNLFVREIRERKNI